MYCKPFSRYTPLKADSNQSNQLIPNIPISQFLRLCRKCSTVTDLQSEAVEIKVHFQHRGYPISYISSAHQRALLTEKKSLLVKKKIYKIRYYEFLSTVS